MRISFHVVAVVLASSFPSLLPALADASPPASAPGQVPEPAGLYQGAMHGYTPETVKGASVVDTSGLAEMISKEHPLLLDVARRTASRPAWAQA